MLGTFLRNAGLHYRAALNPILEDIHLTEVLFTLIADYASAPLPAPPAGDGKVQKTSRDNNSSTRTFVAAPSGISYI